jgi:hypothetical protein
MNQRKFQNDIIFLANARSSRAGAALKLDFIFLFFKSQQPFWSQETRTT